MGKLSIAAVSFCAALLAFNVASLVAPARAGTSVPAGNGDVNGDAEIDISDAVYLLRFLFEVGAPPAACADTPELLARVAVLEARLAAVESPCPSRPDRFQDNGDGTVTDTCTGLMWMKSAADFNQDGIADHASWQSASEYCESLIAGGQEDWRLPSLEEFFDLSTDGYRFPSDSSPWSPPGTPFALSCCTYWTTTPPADVTQARYTWDFRSPAHFTWADASSTSAVGIILAVRGP